MGSQQASNLKRFVTARDPESPSRQTNCEFQPGRCSPVTSEPLGAAFLRLACASSENAGCVSDDVALLHEAIDFALAQPDIVTFRSHTIGTDEVLIGRSGLLWALLLLRDWTEDESISSALGDVFASISKLVNAIVDAGLAASELSQGKDDSTEHDPQSLMWPWLDDMHGLGAMHGSTGILSVLLHCRDQEIRPFMDLSADSITAQSRRVLPYEVTVSPSVAACGQAFKIDNQ